MNILFNSYINNQYIYPATKVQLGFAPLGSNACGWIAAYNAFITLDNYKHPANIVRFIENHNGLILDGAFGINPSVYDELFDYYGEKARTTYNNRKLDETAQSGRTAILCYFHSSGAHYINITWDKKASKYIAYNASKNEFDSIYEYLENNNYKLISLTVIK